jgi:hypothetical protein
VPGWDPANSTGSRANAIAIGPEGAGLLVGKNGRIADLSPGGAVLDPAAGAALCDTQAPVAPCGTGRDLYAAAVSPGGAAIVAGEARALLWRPAGEGFRAIRKPDVPLSTTFLGASMPSPDRAWLATDTGEVWGGRLGANGWNWQRESLNQDGDVLNQDDLGRKLPLTAIAVDSSGHGYAVGFRGLVLERTGEGEHAWKRLATGYTDNFRSIALPAGGRGEGALLGADNGLILTLQDGRFEVARPADFWDPVDNAPSSKPNTASQVVGLALVAGVKAGQTEAWAVLQQPHGSAPAALHTRSPRPGAILHYASDPAEPLLNPQARAVPLPDVLPPRPGELTFAAFGKTGCSWCLEMTGTNITNDVVARRVRDEIADRAGKPGGPAFALFTGDVNQINPNAALYHRFTELIANPLREAGLPLLGAIGGNDITYDTASNFVGNISESARIGQNSAWRNSFKDMPAPWGSPSCGSSCPPTRSGDLSFVPVPSIQGSTDQSSLPGQSPSAHTHYALDVFDTRGTEDPGDDVKTARIVVADTSQGSLAKGDAAQNPIEAKGGQAAWLDAMLCLKDKEGAQSALNEPCTRKPSQRAIVLSSDPTYTYAQINPGRLQTDAAAFESILLRDKANVVVSGHLGWQGLYWALSPGLHYPCPGGTYAEKPPESAGCSQVPVGSTSTPSDKPLRDAAPAAAPALDAAGSADASLRGPLPFVVSSTAGNAFSTDVGSPAAKDGFWHGYSIVRLGASGDSAETIVEQRPVFDWVGMGGDKHVLRPKQKTTLSGYGREAAGIDEPFRYDEISTPVITHSYDLVLADPDKPWLPKVDPKSQEPNHYVTLVGQHCEEPVPHPIGCVNSQSGAVQAGGGNQPRTYALAILSVGDYPPATFPLVFEPRPGLRAPLKGDAPLFFNVPPPAPTALPPNPNPGFAPPAPPAPPAALPPPPQTQVLAATPPLPPGQGASALTLFTSPTPIVVQPSLALFPPAAPLISPAVPVQPSPPQRASKPAPSKSGSGAGDDQDKSEIQHSGGDLATGGDQVGGTSASTRRDPNAFTALARPDQQSAWARDLQWGGGLTLMAMVLAFGWVTVRPTPKRRQPEVPAPAWNRTRRR